MGNIINGVYREESERVQGGRERTGKEGQLREKRDVGEREGKVQKRHREEAPPPP